MKLFWTPFGVKPREEEGGVRYADIYARGVAAGIDLMILFFMLNDFFRMLSEKIYAHIDREKLDAARGAASGFAGLKLLWDAHVLQLWLVNGAIQITVIAALMLGCQCLWYTTPGKWIMGLKVTRAETLARPERWRFVLRFFAYIPAMLPLMIGVIWISFNKQRRGWHDYIAGTVVIHTRPHDWVWIQAKRGVRWLWARRKSAPK